MDWHRETNPFLGLTEIQSFLCDSHTDPSSPSCEYLEITRNNPQVTKSIKLDSAAGWQNFDNSPLFANSTRRYPTPDGLQQVVPIAPAGVYIIIIPSQKVPFSHGGRPTNMRTIPLALPRWVKIASTFMIHHPFNKDTLQSRQDHISSVVSPAPWDVNERLWMNVMIPQVQWGHTGPPSFAMASTHLERDGITTVIITDVDPEAMALVKMLLEDGKKAGTLHHPLFMLSLAAEVMLERLSRIVKDHGNTCFSATGALSHVHNAQKGMQRYRTIDHQLLRKISEAQKKSQNVATAIMNTKRHLERAIKRACSINPTTASVASGAIPNQAHTSQTPKFQRRFDDVLSSLDDLVIDNGRYVEDMSQDVIHIRERLAQEHTQIAQEEAKASARSAESSYVIALMGVFFLPASTLATIFAMPIFKWDSHPLDYKFNVVPSKPSTDEASTASGNSTDLSEPGSKPEDVLTGYFWIYLLASFSLTAFLLLVKRFRDKKRLAENNGSTHPKWDATLAVIGFTKVKSALLMVKQAKQPPNNLQRQSVRLSWSSAVSQPFSNQTSLPYRAATFPPSRFNPMQSIYSSPGRGSWASGQTARGPLLPTTAPMMPNPVTAGPVNSIVGRSSMQSSRSTPGALRTSTSQTNMAPSSAVQPRPLVPPPPSPPRHQSRSNQTWPILNSSNLGGQGYINMATHSQSSLRTSSSASTLPLPRPQHV